MAKSNLQKLQEAIAAGDIEAAKAISDRMVAAEKTKAKAKPALILPAVEDERPSWSAPSRAEGKVQDGRDPGKNYGKTRSMAGMPHVNTYKDDGKGGLDAAGKKAEKELAKQPLTPRPGTKGSDRAVAKKISVKCDGSCGQTFEIYPKHMLLSYEEDGRPYSYYMCDRCLKRRR